MTTSTSKSGFFLDHDLAVVVGALVLLVAGWFAHESMTSTRRSQFSAQGLTFTYPGNWLGFAPSTEQLPLDAHFNAIDDRAIGVDVRITPRPSSESSVGAIRELGRTRDYGDYYKRLETGPKTVAGREWTRTSYIYAQSVEDDAPFVAHAVEYAMMNNDRMYVVTVHGPSSHVTSLEKAILGTLNLK